MKKLFVFCLFIILSLGLFAQQLNTDGEPHFDKITGIKFIKPYYPDGVNYDFFYELTITKKGNDYYITKYSYDPETNKSSTSKEKLKIYKKIYFLDQWDIVYAYDTAKKKVAFLDKNLNLLHYEE